MSRARRVAPVPAAGGVVWRDRSGTTEVALIHRPRYDDWSLPKGKLDPGEPALLGAVREVAEETGSSVTVGRRLSTVLYDVGSTPKRVTYWSMRHSSGRHRPSDEVDRIQWMTLSEASHTLTYPIDHEVLAEFARLPADTSTLLLMRHARAGKRSEWSGDDRLRPLDKLGRRLARDAVDFLAAFAPAVIVAADRVRCQQTVTPVAERLHLDVQTGPELSDEAYAEDPERARTALLTAARAASSVLVCSQGKAIPALLADLDPKREVGSSRKGSVWVLSHRQGKVLARDYYPHPDN